VGVVRAQPPLHDLSVRETCELVEVLLRRHRALLLGEQLCEDLA